MPLIPVPSFPEDFGGAYGDELVSEDWLAVYHNMLEEFFAFGDRAEGHHFQRIIVAFRNFRDPDSFNDLIGGYDLSSGDLRLWRGTTDPGKNPMRRISKLGVHKDGVARLKPGLTKNCLRYGYHHNDRRHPALVQRGGDVIPFERFDTETETWYTPEPQTIRGFNVHRTKFKDAARYVGDWSHGCLVMPNRLEHWRYLLWMGYPTHGPMAAPKAVQNRRLSLALFDITPTSEQTP